MKIYTRTGDQGETGLVGGGRVSKTDLRMEGVGTLDELNAALGLVLQEPLTDLVRDRLVRVQRRLFDIGAELATPADSPYFRPGVPATAVTELEQEIDRLDEGLPPLRNFILPGGTPGAARLHWARTVCRRAERVVVALGHDDAAQPETAQFMNRLSDWLFLAARHENHQAGVEDVIWQREDNPT